MSYEITRITTPFMLNVCVNCYLVWVGNDFILIDTGLAQKRRIIVQALQDAGCYPGDLRLIILTHGDFDHCGNAAYLRDRYSTKIAIHYDDCGMVEYGDMFWNRKQPNIIARRLIGLVMRLRKPDRFMPDFYIQEGDNLREYGFDAGVIELPGHSKGSIGLLTADGDLFCGDLLANISKPDMWSIMDDKQAAANSLNKLQKLTVNAVYPGHGEPFPMQQL